MNSSKHASRQKQRRGIDAVSLDLALGFGVEYKALSHARMYRIRRKELFFLKADCPEPLWRRYRDSLNRLVPLMAGDGQMITAMHRFQKIRRHK